MFRNTLPSPLADTDVTVPADLVPISHLELDLPTPVEGWTVFLAGRGVEITLDDIGRMSVSRGDARQLLIEQREAEARKAEKRAESEKRAVEADRQFRARLGRGVAVPAGLTYAEAVLSAELDARSYQPRRRSLVEDLLSDDGLTFHPVQSGGAES